MAARAGVGVGGPGPALQPHQRRPLLLLFRGVALLVFVCLAFNGIELLVTNGQQVGGGGSISTYKVVREVVEWYDSAGSSNGSGNARNSNVVEDVPPSPTPTRTNTAQTIPHPAVDVYSEYEDSMNEAAYPSPPWWMNFFYQSIVWSAVVGSAGAVLIAGAVAYNVAQAPAKGVAVVTPATGGRAWATPITTSPATHDATTTTDSKDAAVPKYVETLPSSTPRAKVVEAPPSKTRVEDYAPGAHVQGARPFAPHSDTVQTKSEMPVTSTSSSRTTKRRRVVARRRQSALSNLEGVSLGPKRNRHAAQLPPPLSPPPPPPPPPPPSQQQGPTIHPTPPMPEDNSDDEEVDLMVPLPPHSYADISPRISPRVREQHVCQGDSSIDASSVSDIAVRTIKACVRSCVTHVAVASALVQACVCAPVWLVALAYGILTGDTSRLRSFSLVEEKNARVERSSSERRVEDKPSSSPSSLVVNFSMKASSHVAFLCISPYYYSSLFCYRVVRGSVSAALQTVL